MSSVGSEYPMELARVGSLLHHSQARTLATCGPECPACMRERAYASTLEAVLTEAAAAWESGDVVRIIRAFVAMRECQ